MDESRGEQAANQARRAVALMLDVLSREGIRVPGDGSDETDAHDHPLAVTGTVGAVFIEDRDDWVPSGHLTLSAEFYADAVTSGASIVNTASIAGLLEDMIEELESLEGRVVDALATLKQAKLSVSDPNSHLRDIVDALGGE